MKNNITKSDKYQPPLSLQRYVEILLSLGVMGNKLEAERMAGVNRQQFYYHYNKHSEFREWFASQCKKFLLSNESIAAKKLIERISSGDVQAIRLFYELKGDIGRGAAIINNNTTSAENKVVIEYVEPAKKEFNGPDSGNIEGV